MRKITLVFSYLFILVGIFIQVLSNSLEELIPKIGYAAFQSAAAGSYTSDSYRIDLSANYGWSTFCICAGIVGVFILVFENQLRGFIQNRNEK